MATRLIQIDPVRVGPNIVRTAGRPISDRVLELMVQVVSPDWFNHTGVLVYGADYFIDGAWVDGPSFTSPYGETHHNDGVNLPAFKLSGPDFEAATQVRLFASCTPAIRVGADITVFF